MFDSGDLFGWLGDLFGGILQFVIWFGVIGWLFRKGKEFTKTTESTSGWKSHLKESLKQEFDTRNISGSISETPNAGPAWREKDLYRNKLEEDFRPKHAYGYHKNLDELYAAGIIDKQEMRELKKIRSNKRN